MILLRKDCYVNAHITWRSYPHVVERGKCGTFACCAYAKHHVFSYVFIFWLYYFFDLELNTHSKICALDESHAVEWLD